MKKLTILWYASKISVTIKNTLSLHCMKITFKQKRIYSQLILAFFKVPIKIIFLPKRKQYINF